MEHCLKIKRKNRCLNELAENKQCFYFTFSKHVNEKEKLKKKIIKQHQRSNSGLSKHLVVLRKLIVWRNTSLLIVSLYLSQPNKRVSNNISSLNFFKEASILIEIFRSFCLFSAKKIGNARRRGLLFQFQSHNHA